MEPDEEGQEQEMCGLWVLQAPELARNYPYRFTCRHSLFHCSTCWGYPNGEMPKMGGWRGEGAVAAIWASSDGRVKRAGKKGPQKPPHSVGWVKWPWVVNLWTTWMLTRNKWCQTKLISIFDKAAILMDQENAVHIIYCTTYVLCVPLYQKIAIWNGGAYVKWGN